MTPYILRLHIESPDTLYTNPDGTVTSSAQGHTWFEVISPEKKPVQAGFAPIDPKSSATSVPGEIYRDDGLTYGGNPNFTATFLITKRQADLLNHFIDNPMAYGFSKDSYHAVNNSCVDFVWKALNVIGMNPDGRQGALLPMDNKDDFLGLRNSDIQRQPLPTQRRKSLLGLGWYADDRPGDIGEPSFIETNIPDGTVTVGPLGSYLPTHDIPKMHDFPRIMDAWNARFGTGLSEGFMFAPVRTVSPPPMFSTGQWSFNDRQPYSCGRNTSPNRGWMD